MELFEVFSLVFLCLLFFFFYMRHLNNIRAFSSLRQKGCIRRSLQWGRACLLVWAVM